MSQQQGQGQGAQQSTLHLGDRPPQPQQPPSYGQAPFQYAAPPGGGYPPPPQGGYPYPQHGGVGPGGHPYPAHGAVPPAQYAEYTPGPSNAPPGAYPEYKYDDSLPGYSQHQYNPQAQYYYGQHQHQGAYAQQPQSLFQQGGRTGGFSFLNGFPVAFAVSFLCGIICPIFGPACVVCFAPSPEAKAGAASAYAITLIIMGAVSISMFPISFGSFDVQDCVDWQLEHNSWAKNQPVENVRRQCSKTKNYYISFGSMMVFMGVLLGGMVLWMMIRMKKARNAAATAETSAASNIELEAR